MLVLSPLQSAICSLENAISVAEEYSSGNDSERRVRDVIEAGVILNYKFTYELCYKFMVRWISLNVSPEDASPRTKREIFMTASRFSLIQDPIRWLEYTESRNLTSHTYDRKKADQVLSAAPGFLEDARFFLHELERMND